VSTYLLLLALWSAVITALDVFSIVIAVRERRRGAPRWAWMVPWGFGILLLCLSVVRLVWAVS
jgi:VIT1/CCC1 family predicted Fe2+/Mn2+ transporter